MFKRYLDITSFIAVLLIFSVSGCSRVENNPYFELQGYTMGTRYHIKLLNTDNDSTKLKNMQADVDAILDTINRKMSTWIKDSELSRFNDSPVGHWYQVSNETFEVIEAGLEVYRQSAGRFDITVGPLVSLWGFNSNTIKHQLPEEKSIQATLKNIGSNFLELDKQQKRLKKLKPVAVDLSAIAKGYAVDRLADYLLKKGYKHFLVEIGGEVKANGFRQTNPGKSGNQQCNKWRIAIETPLTGKRQVYEVIAIGNEAVATSGDYRNYFEKNGKRYSHTIDPLSGYPITHKLASVTIIHESTMIADALATAILVMGSNEGIQFADKNGIAAFLIVKSANGFKHVYSSAYQARDRTIQCD